MKKNISFKEASELIMGEANRIKLQSEVIDLYQSLNRVVYNDIKAKISNPQWDNSAMDGFAVRVDDLKQIPATLRIIETIFAGDKPEAKLKKGEAAGIMTGAQIPEGADAVVPVEYTNVEGNFVKIMKKVEKEENIRKSGEDYKKGELLVKKGSKLNPAQIGLIASTGIGKLKVFRNPEVAIIVTGTELTDYKKNLKEGKIYDSNSYSLYAQVLLENCKPFLIKLVKDDKRAIKNSIVRALKKDVLIVSGGISMGKADYVKEVLSDLKGRFIFSKVRQRPGNPFTFLKLNGKPVFLLPGNPVSTEVCFEIYVRPFLQKICGLKNVNQNVINCRIKETIKVKKGKTYFLRVLLKKEEEEVQAFLTGPQGSGIITSMSKADGILIVKEDCEEIKKDCIMPVFPLSWSKFC